LVLRPPRTQMLGSKKKIIHLCRKNTDWCIHRERERERESQSYVFFQRNAYNPVAATKRPLRHRQVDTERVREEWREQRLGLDDAFLQEGVSKPAADTWREQRQGVRAYTSGDYKCQGRKTRHLIAEVSFLWFLCLTGGDVMVFNRS
jgi:hypothetical protein